MARFNLFTWQAEFRSLVLQQGLQPDSAKAISDNEVNLRLSDALIRIQNEYGIQISRNVDVAITVPVTGTPPSYALPADRLGTTIYQVTVTQGSGSTAYQVPPLQYLDNATFNSLYNQTTTANDSGPPRNWTFNPADNTEILIRPIPTQAGTLSVLYNPTAEQLWRVYNQRVETVSSISGVTVILTNGLPMQVTTPKPMLVGDSFGIITTAQADGTAAFRPAPDWWATILAAAYVNPGPTIHLTLDQAYPKDPNALGSGYYITAQTPTFQGIAPDIMGNAPAIYAAAIYCDNLGQTEKADRLMKRASTALDACRPKRPPQTTYRDMSPFVQSDYPYGGIYYNGGGYYLGQ